MQDKGNDSRSEWTCRYSDFSHDSPSQEGGSTKLGPSGHFPVSGRSRHHGLVTIIRPKQGQGRALLHTLKHTSGVEWDTMYTEDINRLSPGSQNARDILVHLSKERREILLVHSRFTSAYGLSTAGTPPSQQILGYSQGEPQRARNFCSKYNVQVTLAVFMKKIRTSLSQEFTTYSGEDLLLPFCPSSYPVYCRHKRKNTHMARLTLVQFPRTKAEVRNGINSMPPASHAACSRAPSFFHMHILGNASVHCLCKTPLHYA